jgi:hypothetical protein
MLPKKVGAKATKKSARGKQAKPASAPAIVAGAAPSSPDDDSISLHPDTDEEAALLAELQQLQQSKLAKRNNRPRQPGSCGCSNCGSKY